MNGTNVHVREDGLVCAMGTAVRPYDPAERKYALRATIPLVGIDINAPHVLWTDELDPRPEPYDQGNYGSCAACAASFCVHVLGQRNSIDVPALSYSWLYTRARQDIGTFPQDSGLYLANALDRAINGIVKVSVAPLTDNPAVDYPASNDADAPNQDYALSHRPFYPTEGGVIENICASLDLGYPVQVGAYWPYEWFTPGNNGIVTPNFQKKWAGGHSFAIWGHIQGYSLCRNSWGKRYSPSAPGFGWGMREGDFAIPDSVVAAKDTNIFEYRAVAPHPVQPNPPLNSCKDRALTIANKVVSDQQARFDAKPRSTTFRYQVQGGMQVRDALAVNLEG